MPSVIDTGIVGYVMNSSTDYSYHMNSARLITGSCAKTNSHLHGMDNSDDNWLVFPGYILHLYVNQNYILTSGGGNAGVRKLNNSGGVYPKMFALNSNTNRVSSFKAFYKDDSNSVYGPPASGYDEGKLPDMSSSTHHAYIGGPY